MDVGCEGDPLDGLLFLWLVGTDFAAGEEIVAVDADGPEMRGMRVAVLCVGIKRRPLVVRRKNVLDVFDRDLLFGL